MPTISCLSEDLVTEILSRTTVKTIIRCKCVCKLWRKLATNPNFPKLHFHHSNSRNPNLILKSTFYTNFISIDSDSFDEILTLNPNLPSVAGTSMVGSCNGLICLSDSKTFASIWNPATNECVQLPFDPIRAPKSGNRCSIVMGFGYDHVLDKYKVIRIVFYFDIYRITEFDSCEVKVYTLGSDSWRIIGDDGRAGGGGGSPPFYIGNSLTKVAHVNGVLHWVGVRAMGIMNLRSIVSFDLKEEKFGEVAWPDFDEGNRRDLRLGVLNGWFSVFCYYMEHVDIWVMKVYGEHESWTRLYSVGRPTKFLEPLAFWNNGEIVLQMGHGKLLLYDPLSQSSRVLNVFGIPDRFRAGTYVESLTSIASVMAGNSDEEQQ